MQGWKKFEHLVARIHETLEGSQYEVTHNVKVRELAGAEHQIDVLMTPKSAFIAPVLVSAKSSADPVGIEHIRAWSDIVSQTGAAAGVIVSPTGFTAGAIEAAKNPARRISLWVPRPLTPDDFAPDERSPDGYIQIIHTTLHLRELRPSVETFVLDLESATGKKEGREIEFRFSAETRQRYFLRNERDEVGDNLWDMFIAAAEAVRETGTIRIQTEAPSFVVLDGYRLRFNSLSMEIVVSEFTIESEYNVAQTAFAYENVVTGAVRMVPLPPSMLAFSDSEA